MTNALRIPAADYGASELVTVVELGEQALTGVFPATAEQPVSRGPVELI